MCAQLMKNEHSGKQIRERWREVLRPGIRRTQWTYNEDQQIFQMWKKIGKKWKNMSQSQILRGRTENQIKNRFNSFVKKYLIIEEDKDNSEVIGQTELIQCEEEIQSKLNIDTQSQNFIESIFTGQSIDQQENCLDNNFNLILSPFDDKQIEIDTNNEQQQKLIKYYQQRSNQLSTMSNQQKSDEFDFSHCLDLMENREKVTPY